jgi:O-antigen/teichoic acid export membrane protein
VIRAREVLLTLAARCIAMIGPLGVSIITARVLGPEDRGHYFLVVAYAQIAAQIANLGLHSSNTYIGARQPELAGKLLANGLYVAALVGPATALIVLAVTGGSTSFADTLAVALLAPLTVAFLYSTNIVVAIGRVDFFNYLSILAGGAALAGSVLAAIFYPSTDGFLLMTGSAIALSVAASIVIFSRIHENLPVSFDLALFRRGVAYSFRAYLATMMGFLMMRVGVVALQQQSTLAEIGQFSIATQIAEALALIPSTVGLLLFPSLMRTKDADQWRSMIHTMAWIAGLMFFLLVVVYALSEAVIIHVFGHDYRDSIVMTNILLVMVWFLSLLTVVSQYLSARGFPWGQVVAWGVGLSTQTALSFVLVPRLGGTGVAIALSASTMLVFAIICLVAVRTHQGSKMPEPEAL